MKRIHLFYPTAGDRLEARLGWIRSNCFQVQIRLHPTAPRHRTSDLGDTVDEILATTETGLFYAGPEVWKLLSQLLVVKHPEAVRPTTFNEWREIEASRTRNPAPPPRTRTTKTDERRLHLVY